ncbi:hypothetical protein GCM10025771_29160 [Niveibacterium umoris]|uniref:GSCFA domain-containing protein n=1 Tax=Niveibacterium umoris TaxID=1193620 RepID=A0A840BED0_9RHOO|nr:GSCFA domain-containing protein [Niveibacterium umoris]MBB4011891.1 hypothetical protein [Niveibacterium umoris]
MNKYSANEAWQNLNQENPNARWKNFAARALDGAIMAEAHDPVRMHPDDRVFCMGSCFAKNIELRLLDAGLTVLSHPRFAPKDGSPFTPLPNIFNIQSVLNELSWAFDVAPHPPEANFVNDDEGFCYDPHSTIDLFRCKPEDARKRRAGVTANMRRLASCDVLILTLGLVEVWFDNKTGTYLNATLPQRLLTREPGRYELRVLDYQAVRDGLEKALALLRQFGKPDLELVISVSPVPLAATFRPIDVVIANNYSKATQVAAVLDFVGQNPGVHYVPSFETVTMSARRFVWEEDLRHVTPDIVARITQRFVAAIQDRAIAAPAAVPTDWPAQPYEVARNPDTPNFTSATPGDRDFPAGFPIVTASSCMEPRFDASGFMSTSRRIWHAERCPGYPQWVEFSFARPLTVRRLLIQSQEKHPERAPRRFSFHWWNGECWVSAATDVVATWDTGGQWLGWDLGPVTSQRFKLEIFENSGDPTYLTIHNVYLKP